MSDHREQPEVVIRLTELVIHLSGAPGEAARVAVTDALDRNGDGADHLLNVADALVAVRHDAELALRPDPQHQPAET